jgi:hypothetical protein
VDLIDWDANVDPYFKSNHFVEPVPARDEMQTRSNGYFEQWVSYKSRAFSAKELTLLPGRTATVVDSAAYGLILLEGYGTLGVHKIDTPSVIRFGELTNDEFFVTESAAKTGVTICNASTTESLVMLKHFGPDNPDLSLLS